MNNVPDSYDGDANFGIGESCEACGDPLTEHRCSSCGELLACDDCGDTDTQVCEECGAEEERIGVALDVEEI